MELQGHEHWYLRTQLYCEKDGSYILDQEMYVCHILNRYYRKDSIWGLPQEKDTSAPVDDIYKKENHPTAEQDKNKIAKWFPDLSMARAISSLLYCALNTRSDIL